MSLKNLTTGIGKAHAAITVINGIPSGKGGAIGLNLSAVAYVTLTGSNNYTINQKRSQNHPAVVTADKLLKKYNHLPGAIIRIKSEIPVAKGLKSSSAIQVATAFAVLDALKVPIPPALELLKLLVDAAKQAKITITGGLDDLAGCMLGGLVLTNNHTNEILLHTSIHEYQVILITPKESILTSTVKFQSNPIIEQLFSQLHKLAQTDVFSALTLNGVMYSQLSGLETGYLEPLLRVPVIGVGLSGKGPAVAIICHSKNVNKAKRIAKRYGPIIDTNLTNEGLSL